MDDGEAEGALLPGEAGGSATSGGSRWGTSHRKVRARISRAPKKLLANLQKGWGNLVETIFEGLQEQGRLKITEKLRRSIEVDNQDAVKMGELEENSEAINVVRPSLNWQISPKASVREGVNEIDASNGRGRKVAHLY